MNDLVQIRARLDGGDESAQAARPGLFIRTFGCQMNEYDSEKVAKLLESGYQRVDDPAAAEIIIINTCSVREKPEQKLYSLLGELREHKLRDPRVVIGVGGCVAQQEGAKIIARDPSVDFVFGTHNLSLVPSLIDRRRGGFGPQVAVDYRDEWEELPLGVADAGETREGRSAESRRTSAFISISRGCNKACTYCIVPTTRGPEVSRGFDEILREVRIAAHRGAREIVLLGQTVNSYGLDFTPRRSFADLMTAVGEIDGIERIRFTSPHPQEVRKDFFDLVEKNPKVCRHIHLPLQSGSDRILKLMNRNYRKRRYLEIIRELQSRVPDLAITTDIIVGFPGESEDEFRETLDLMREVHFASSYSFMFSPRPGTVAGAMEDDVPHADKLRRLQELQAVQFELSTSYLTGWIGKTVDVLLDGPSSHDPALMQGRISQNILVNLRNSAPECVPGAFVPVVITEAMRYTLRGEVSMADGQAAA